LPHDRIKSTPQVSSTTGASAATGVTAVPGKTYTADLSGKNVVPAVETTATGLASFTVDATGTRIQFALSVSNITDVIAARVHVGQAGSNGPGVLILYPGPTQRAAPLPETCLEAVVAVRQTEVLEVRAVAAETTPLGYVLGALALGAEETTLGRVGRATTADAARHIVSCIRYLAHEAPPWQTLCFAACSQ
jgi:CHRD domain